MWHKKIIYKECKKCGKLCETKSKVHAMCSECVQKYLNDLESMANEIRKETKSKEQKKRDYNIIQCKIARQRESLVGVPRTIEVETVERHCLTCNKWFLAQGKYNRICDGCKVIHQGSNDLWER